MMHQARRRWPCSGQVNHRRHRRTREACEWSLRYLSEANGSRSPTGTWPGSECGHRGPDQPQSVTISREDLPFKIIHSHRAATTTGSRTDSIRRDWAADDSVSRAASMPSTVMASSSLMLRSRPTCPMSRSMSRKLPPVMRADRQGYFAVGCVFGIARWARVRSKGAPGRGHVCGVPWWQSAHRRLPGDHGDRSRHGQVPRPGRSRVVTGRPMAAVRRASSWARRRPGSGGPSMTPFTAPTSGPQSQDGQSRAAAPRPTATGWHTRAGGYRNDLDRIHRILFPRSFAPSSRHLQSDPTSATTVICAPRGPWRWWSARHRCSPSIGGG